MRITVIGAILIVAAAIATVLVVLVVRALIEKRHCGPQRNEVQ